jgi:hypothetical protein
MFAASTDESAAEAPDCIRPGDGFFECKGKGQKATSAVGDRNEEREPSTSGESISALGERMVDSEAQATMLGIATGWLNQIARPAPLG